MGTGDDAAVFAATGETAISTDTIVEGRHFRLDLSSPPTDRCALGGAVGCPMSLPWVPAS